MKYILVLFAVLLLLACSDAKPNKGRGKQNEEASPFGAETCKAQLSWLSEDAKSAGVLQCFEDHGYDLCRAVPLDPADIGNMCKTEMKTFRASLGQSHQQHLVNALHDRERRRTTGGTGTGTTSLGEECRGNLVSALSVLLQCGGDFSCTITTILDMEDTGDSDPEEILECALRLLLFILPFFLG